MTGPIEFLGDYTILPYKFGKLGGRFLITNDIGSWAVLTKDEMELLRSHKIQENPSLFSRLKDSEIILMADNLGVAKETMKDRLWFLHNGASLHVVAVTNACNFACKYCYADAKNARHMSVETARKVVDFIFQSPAKSLIIEFSGGDPLMNFKAIKTIVEYAEAKVPGSGKSVNFSMINNGSNWNDEKMNFFIEHKIGLCFSLDGPEDLHNKHRPYKAGGATYGDVVKWMKKFRKADYHFNVIPVVTRYSLSRGREIVDEYLSQGVRDIRFKYLGFFGRASEVWEDIGYSPEEYLKTWKDVIDYMYDLNNRGIFVKESLASLIAMKLFHKVDPGYCELQMPCGAGISQIAYSPDGSIYTCDEGRMFDEFKIGDVNMTHSDVLKSPVLKSMVLFSSGFFDICNDCELKPFCGLCPVESYHHQGDIESKVVFDRRHKIHEGMIRYLIERSADDPKFQSMLIEWAKLRTSKLVEHGKRN